MEIVNGDEGARLFLLDWVRVESGRSFEARTEGQKCAPTAILYHAPIPRKYLGCLAGALPC